MYPDSRPPDCMPCQHRDHEAHVVGGSGKQQTIGTWMTPAVRTDFSSLAKEMSVLTRFLRASIGFINACMAQPPGSPHTRVSGRPTAQANARGCATARGPQASP